MGSVRAVNGDWIRINQQRYLGDDTPSSALDAVQHVLAARAALAVGEPEVARFMYRGAQRLWRRMEVMQPGKWRHELQATSSEMKKADSQLH